MAKPATAATERLEWAARAGRAIVDTAARVAHDQEQHHAAAQALQRAVSQTGDAYVTRLAASVAAAVDAFNLAVGMDIARVMPQPGSGITVRCPRSGSSAQITPDISTPTYGLVWAQQVFSNRSTRFFALVLDGEALALSVDGAVLAPEAAAETLVGGWLAALSLQS